MVQFPPKMGTQPEPASPEGRRGLAVFILIAFGLAWPVQVGLALVSRQAAALASVGILVLPTAFLLMWPPALGAYVARRWVEKSGFGDAGLRWPAPSYILLAWFGPALLTLISAALSIPIYPPDTELSTLRSLLASAGGQPVPAEAVLAAQVAAALTVAVPTNGLLAFGEEFGWRGYLLPRLMTCLGPWPGLLAHGAVWGFWHAPIVFLASYNYPGHPTPNAAGVGLFTVFCILLGLSLAWLRLASESVVPPAVAHGALNAIGGLPLLLLRGVDPAVAGPLWSPVGWVVLGLAAALLFAARNPLRPGA